MTQNFKNEQEFNREVVKFLRDKLKKEKIEGIYIVGGYDRDATDNYLLRDFTFLKANGQWYLYGGAQEIDVIIYKETIDKNRIFNNSIKTTGTGIRGNIIVPLVIMELKLSKFSSHDAISSNVIAGDIKRLFPRVKAMFIYDNFEGLSSPEMNISFRRMLFNFNHICLSWEQEKEDIWQELKRDLEKQK